MTAGTRVTVKSPVGSAFDGRTGTVTFEHPESTTVMVRLDALRGARGTECELPFGRRELEVLK